MSSPSPAGTGSSAALIMKDFLPVEDHSQTTSQSCLFSAEQHWTFSAGFISWALLWPFQTLNHPTFFLGGAQFLLEAVTCCLKSNNFIPRISAHIFQKFILWSVTVSSIILKCCCPALHTTLPQQMFCPSSNCSYFLFQSIFSAPWSFLSAGKRDVDF